MQGVAGAVAVTAGCSGSGAGWRGDNVVRESNLPNRGGSHPGAGGGRYRWCCAPGRRSAAAAGGSVFVR